AVTVKKGNPAAVSDAGVAALLARSAVEGAAYNVEINLTSIKDTKIVEKLQQRARQLLEESYAREKEILLEVKRRL
ncbi:MAG TPA: cyclodeaminase/cyclohydrolase family protein, partial [Firmicutes bacterium]|nr:cyclodeaminase/cyclohydrolase family protein [Bacillota bacterium]